MQSGTREKKLSLLDRWIEEKRHSTSIIRDIVDLGVQHRKGAEKSFSLIKNITFTKSVG